MTDQDFSEETLAEARRVIVSAGARLFAVRGFILESAIALARETGKALDHCVRSVIADVIDKQDQDEIKKRMYERTFGSWKE